MADNPEMVCQQAGMQGQCLHLLVRMLACSAYGDVLPLSRRFTRRGKSEQYNFTADVVRCRPGPGQVQASSRPVPASVENTCESTLLRTERAHGYR